MILWKIFWKISEPLYKSLFLHDIFYVYIDTLHLEAAGGKIEMSGYFNGSNKDKIYFVF